MIRTILAVTRRISELGQQLKKSLLTKLHAYFPTPAKLLKMSIKENKFKCNMTNQGLIESNYSLL